MVIEMLSLSLKPAVLGVDVSDQGVDRILGAQRRLTLSFHSISKYRLHAFFVLSHTTYQAIRQADEFRPLS